MGADFVLNVRANGTGAFAQHAKAVEQSVDKIKTSALGLDGIFTRFGARFAGIAAAGGIANSILGEAKQAQELEKMSRAAGTSVDFLLKLRKGAGETGTEFDALADSYKQFSQIVAQFQSGMVPRGGGNAMRGMSILGFSEKDLRGQDAERLFLSLTQRMREGAVSAEQYAAGLRLLGQGFTEVAEASRKGLGGTLQRPLSTIEQSNQEVLAGAGEKVDQFGAGLGTLLRTQANAWLTGGKFLAGGGLKTFGRALNQYSPFGGNRVGNWVSARGDEWLTDAMQSFYPTGASFSDTLARRDVDKGNRSRSSTQLDAMRTQLRTLLGSEADDVLEQLDESGATPSMYQSYLRRAKRSHRQSLGRELQTLNRAIDVQADFGLKGSQRRRDREQELKEQVRLQREMVSRLQSIDRAIKEE